MLEAEKQALLQQVTVHIEATERRLRALGLRFVKVGLYDERTRGPIIHHDSLIDMANGKCVCGAAPEPSGRIADDAHRDGCPIAPTPAPALGGGEPAERAEGSGQ